MSNTRNEKPEPDIPKPDRPEPGEDTAIEFLRLVAGIRLSSEPIGEDEDPEDPVEILDSLISKARELAAQEKADEQEIQEMEECGTEVD